MDDIILTGEDLKWQYSCFSTITLEYSLEKTLGQHVQYIDWWNSYGLGQVVGFHGLHVARILFTPSGQISRYGDAKVCVNCF